MGNRVRRGLLVGAVMIGTLGACGDDDDDTVAPTPDGAEQTGDNALEIEMIDYGYKVSGKLRPGLATITSKNTGDEFHMAGFGKLKPGKTVAELTKALEAAGEGEGGGGGGPEGGGGGGAPEGGQQGTGEIKAASVSQEGGGEGGGGGGDPTAEFIEKQLGTPGHILQPGQSQTLTVDVLEEGSYVMICFLPTEGEGGKPHFANGMVGGFEVAKGESKAAAPEADATITLGDDAEPVGAPTDLKAGEHTFKITASGAKSKDFIIASLKDDKPFSAFDDFFNTELGKEGGPDKGAANKAPGTIYASTFAIEPGESIWVTVEVASGEAYFVSSTNSEGEGESDTVDKFVKVNVT